VWSNLSMCMYVVWRKDEWMNEWRSCVEVNLTLNAESAAGGNNRVCHRFSLGRWDFNSNPARSNYYSSTESFLSLTVLFERYCIVLYGYCIGSTGGSINYSNPLAVLQMSIESSYKTTQGCFLCCHTKLLVIGQMPIGIVAETAETRRGRGEKRQGDDDDTTSLLCRSYK